MVNETIKQKMGRVGLVIGTLAQLCMGVFYTTGCDEWDKAPNSTPIEIEAKPVTVKRIYSESAGRSNSCVDYIQVSVKSKEGREYTLTDICDEEDEACDPYFNSECLKYAIAYQFVSGSGKYIPIKGELMNGTDEIVLK